jgi:hypothetical protein
MPGVHVVGQRSSKGRSMDFKGLNFFGRYLLDKGIITPDQLAEAIAFQDESNRRIGDIAKERGYLSKTQIEFIFEEQKRVDRPFGAIALEHRLLTRGQLDDLLFTQTVLSTHLGEALLMKGFITPEQFSEELDLFKDEQRQREEALQRLLRDYAEHALYEAMIGAVCKAFLRIAGRSLKIGALCPREPQACDLRFEVRVRTAEKGEVAGILFISRQSAAEFLSGGNGGSAPPAHHCVQQFLEFMSVIERYFRQSCQQLDLHVEESVCNGGEFSGEVLPGEDDLFVQLSTPVGLMTLQVCVEHGKDRSPCSDREVER